MELFHFCILTKILNMKRLKICITGIMLLFSIAGFSQEKHKLPPPPPRPQIKAIPPVPPEDIAIAELNVSPPPLPDIKEGHPWTKNGQTVWVAKPPKPVPAPKIIKPAKPAIPPPPPPPPPTPRKHQ
jgi:hypothetical protein